MATIRPLNAINTSAKNGCPQPEHVQSKASISYVSTADAATPIHAAPSSTENERLDLAILSMSKSTSTQTQKQPKQICTVLKSALRPSRFSFKELKCNNSDMSYSSENTNAPPRSSQHDPRSEALTKGPRSPTLSPRQSSGRRVRGLWNLRDDSNCPFSQFHDEILSEGIFGFLSLEDREWAAALTCRRFAFCSNLPGCWRDVDATGFVQRFYDSSLKRALIGSSDRIARESAEKETSKALIHILSRHKHAIEGLSIQNIHDKLSTDVAVMGIGPCLTSGKLQELRLSHYNNLHDSALNLMFLTGAHCVGAGGDATQTIRRGSANGNHRGEIVSVSPRFKLASKNNKTSQILNNAKDGSLSALALEFCPVLTDRSLCIIAAKCDDLTKLSVKGCHNITDAGVLELAPLLKVRRETDVTTTSNGGDKLDGIDNSFETPPSSPVSKGASCELSSLFESCSPPSIARSLPSAPSLMSMFEAPSSSVSPTNSKQVQKSFRSVASNITPQPYRQNNASALEALLNQQQQQQQQRQNQQNGHLVSLDLSETGITTTGIFKLCNAVCMTNSIDRLEMDDLIVSVGEHRELAQARNTLQDFFASPRLLTLLP